MAFWNGEKSRSKPQGQASQQPPAEEEAPDLSGLLLKTCVQRSAVATVTMPSSGNAVVLGVFKQVASNHVTLAFDPPLPRSPVPGTACTVSFFEDNTCGAFVAHAFRYAIDERMGGLLTLELPERISTMEARRMFRIPADDELPVFVTVRHDEVSPEVGGYLIDLNRIGIAFRTDEALDALELGREAMITCVWKEEVEAEDDEDEPPPPIVHRATAEGILARARDGEVAVAITDENEVLEENGFVSLVSLVERVVLRRRSED